MPEFKITDHLKAENYCIKNIGERQFWLHHARGGENWFLRYDRNRSCYFLTIDDEKKALLAMLFLSDQ